MNEQVVCDHLMGIDHDDDQWEEHHFSDAMATNDALVMGWLVDLVENGTVFDYCPYCGERIDWNAIKAQLNIE